MNILGKPYMRQLPDPYAYPFCPYCGSRKNDCEHVLGIYEFQPSWPVGGYLYDRIEEFDGEIVRFFTGFVERYGYDLERLQSGNKFFDKYWKGIVTDKMRNQTNGCLSCLSRPGSRGETFGLMLGLSGVLPAGGFWEFRENIPTISCMEVFFSPDPPKEVPRMWRRLRRLMKKAIHFAENWDRATGLKYKEKIAPLAKEQTFTFTEDNGSLPDNMATPDMIQQARTDSRIRLVELKIFDPLDNAKKFNHHEGFKLYRNTLSYITKKHEEHFGDEYFAKGKGENWWLFLFQMSFLNPYEGARQMNHWKILEGTIPRLYFDVMEVDPDVLDFVLDLDIEEYLDTLNKPVVMDKFVVRYNGGVYGAREMPPTTDEMEAIQFVRNFHKKSQKRCCINIWDLKTIFIEPDNTVKIEYFYPELRKLDTCYQFSGSNRENGTMRIG